jgi:hypothetical protein
MRKLSLSLLLFSLLLLAACGGNNSQATVQPVPASTNISLATNPNPARVGDVELRFTVTDASDQPVTGASFDVFADHTDMSGMTMHGTATEQGNGVYSITANFSMTGNWKLSIEVKKDDLSHKQDIQLKVQ